MAEPALNDPPMSMDEVKESITAKGRERGFVTSEDLLEAVPVDDLTPEQVEEFLTQIQEHLTAEAIEVIEVPGEDSDPRPTCGSRWTCSRPPPTTRSGCT